MLAKLFDAKGAEAKWSKAWEAGKIGAADPAQGGTPYVIMMPPPNVTGTLHMGHALTMGLQDLLTRYHRMRGNNTLWQPGMDHAGIAVQAIVDAKLDAEGVRKEELGRAEFLRRAWAWKEDSGGTITRQLRALGASPDWDRERFTMDAGLSAAVKHVFVTLYEQDLIYKDKRLVNWDTKLQTAISDLEVEQKETQGHLWYLRYPLANDPTRVLIVATTRPETMLGDTGVAVHPEDPRFQRLIGQQVRLPLTGRLVPIVGDTHADPEKGTGAVKITPAHDFNDFEVGRRHNLDMINILNRDGTLNDAVPEMFQGLTVLEARQRVVAQAEAEGWLEKVEAHVLQQPTGDRSKTVVEPYLTEQWFADAAKLAEPAIAAVERGETTFVPDAHTKIYYDWMRRIQPWCISRQLWWGHQIPAWYDEAGEVYVAVDEAAAQAQAGPDAVLRQDPDVLDTWFSSALWPFSTLGWPEKTEALAAYYPGSVLVTGHDILFFWVARMMMMGLHFMGQVPFRQVYIHALVRDEQGAKMSKSKGNIIDPLDVSDQYGTDALRFTLAAMASPGNDLKLSMERVEDSRNFITKLWNTAKYIELNECSVDADFDPNRLVHPLNQWILGELAQAQTNLEQALAAYHFNEAAAALYHFTWDLFCPWYLEFTKPLLDSQDRALAKETKATLAYGFGHLLRLLHPLIPFVTEEVWDGYFRAATAGDKTAQGTSGFLSLQAWPQALSVRCDAARADLDFVRDLISAVRIAKADLTIPPGSRVSLQVIEPTAMAARCLEAYGPLLKFVGRIDQVSVVETAPDGAVSLVVQGGAFFLPVAGLIDIGAERQRLTKERVKVEAAMEKLDKTLNNPNFLARAPDAVVTKQRHERAALEEDLSLLREAENRLDQI